MESPSDVEIERRVARGAAVRLALIAVLWGGAAVRLGWLGVPWTFEPGGVVTGVAFAIGTALGLAQGYVIARRAGPRLLRWTREGALSRKRDLVIVARGVIVVVGFAGLGRAVKWELRETHPEVAGAVYLLACVSLVVASAELVRLCAGEARRSRTLG
jgi:hypothetical protein